MNNGFSSIEDLLGNKNTGGLGDSANRSVRPHRAPRYTPPQTSLPTNTSPVQQPTQSQPQTTSTTNSDYQSL